MNFESPQDVSIDHRNIADNLLQSLYDERSEESASPTVPSSSVTREHIGLIQEKIDSIVQLNNDKEVIVALQALLTRINEVYPETVGKGNTNVVLILLI